jgi:hypothetical protein
MDQTPARPSSHTCTYWTHGQQGRIEHDTAIMVRKNSRPEHSSGDITPVCFEGSEEANNSQQPREGLPPSLYPISGLELDG